MPIPAITVREDNADCVDGGSDDVARDTAGFVLSGGTVVTGGSAKRMQKPDSAWTLLLVTTTHISLKSFIAGPIIRGEVLTKNDQVLFPWGFSMTFVVPEYVALIPQAQG